MTRMHGADGRWPRSRVHTAPPKSISAYTWRTCVRRVMALETVPMAALVVGSGGACMLRTRPVSKTRYQIQY